MVRVARKVNKETQAGLDKVCQVLRSLGVAHPDAKAQLDILIEYVKNLKGGENGKDR